MIKDKTTTTTTTTTTTVSYWHSYIDEEPYGSGVVPEWRIKERKILKDIKLTVSLIKEILQSNRYNDGKCLCAEDKKVVVDKLLAYKPDCVDKIDVGLDSISYILMPHQYVYLFTSHVCTHLY
ncbi:hypothetical protein ACFE04_009895 [Oxalis oulophora]